MLENLKAKKSKCTDSIYTITSSHIM